MVKHVDSGGQVHLVTNIRKPRKWRRYEYLLSSGTQYIDTGWVTDYTKNFEVTSKYNASSSGTRGCILSSYSAAKSTSLEVTTNSRFWLHEGSLDNSIAASVEVNHVSIFSYGGGIWKHQVDGGAALTGSASYSDSAGASAYMFLDRALRTTTFNKLFKIYYLTIKENGTLIRNFVPALYNGQYGMWDLVEDKFYPNKGTGSFTVGAEMKNYDEIDEVRKTSSLLPAGVELYDYILSSGTQYINTGIYPSLLTKAEVDLLFTSLTKSSVLGSYNGNNWNYLFALNSDIDTFFNLWGSNHGGNTAKDLNRHYHKFERNGDISWSYTVDNSTYNNTGGVTTLSSNEQVMYLFACNSNGTLYRQSYVKMYYCRILNGSTLVRNFLPCTYLGEPGMWDTVENKFYRNQGTGLFTLGNKITLKEYEYLEATGTQYINTNYIPKNTSGIYLKAYCTTSGGNHTAVGCRLDTGNTRWWINYSSTLEISWNNWTGTITNYTNTWTEVEHNYMNTRSAKVNGIALTVSYPTLANITYPAYIFKGNNGTTGTFEGRISNVKITEGSSLVHDYIPVSYNGTPGLWDKVEWKFYANAGSGSFTLGPEKASGVYSVRRTLIDELLFTFRQTAGGLKVMKPIAKLNSIKGNSVAWNQLIPNDEINNTSNSYITYTDNNGIITIDIKQGTMNAQYDAAARGRIHLIATHKYIYLLNESCPVTTYIIYDGSRTFNANIVWTQSITYNTAVLRLRAQKNATYTIGTYVIIPMLFDLTVMYGEGNEPTSVNQFRNDYFKWFGHPIDYEPYDQGSIRNVKIDSLKINSFNLFNNWANQFVAAENGNFVNNSSSIRSDYIKMLPGVQYYAELNVGDLRMRYYDNNKRYLGYKGQIQARKAIFSMTYNNGTYVVLTQYPANDVPAADPTKITCNISDTSLNGIVEPHEDRTYSIPITSITGKLNGSGSSVVVFPDGMKSAGSVHDEILVENGVTKAIKRIGSVDLGSANWVKQNTTNGHWRFYRQLSSIKQAASAAVVANIICSKYVNVTPNDTWTGPKVGISANSSSASVDVFDESYSDAGAFKTAMNGVMLVYELNTPEEYILDNFTLPQSIKVERGGTEEIISTDTTSVGPTLLMEYTL